MFLLLFCIIKSGDIIVSILFVAAYKSEVEITPSPIEETTTKKSGFFGGIKNFFRGSSTTTTVAPLVAPSSTAKNQEAHRPPALNIQHSPMVPLGPRPDTPPSAPLGGNQHLPPQWPQVSSTTVKSPQHAGGIPPFGAGSPQMQQPSPFGSGSASNRPITQPIPQQNGAGAIKPLGPQGSVHSSGQKSGHGSAGQPVLPPGFGQYQPNRPQPSGVDLSYGGGRPQASGNNRPGFGLAPLTSTTTTTTTRPQSPQKPGYEFDLRNNFDTSSTTKKPITPNQDFPALPSPRRPSTGPKEDYPALPVPKSPTPSSPSRPASPSAWNVPLPTSSTPSSALSGNKDTLFSTTPASSARPGSPPVGDRVSFVPQSGSTTTARPGSATTSRTVATDAEIQALTEQLYTKEVNNQISLIRINLQGKTRSIDSTDEAPQP